MKCLIEYISFVWFSVWHQQTVALHSSTLIIEWKVNKSRILNYWIAELLNECCWYYVITIKTKSMWCEQINEIANRKKFKTKTPKIIK